MIYFEYFGDVLRAKGKERGMKVEKPLEIQTVDASKIEQYTKEYKHQGFQLIVFIIFDSNRDGYYQKIKQFSELSFGILTQCVRSRNVVNKNLKSVADNIILKVINVGYLISLTQSQLRNIIICFR